MLGAMTHPSKVLNLDIKQSFFMPKSDIYIYWDCLSKTKQALLGIFFRLRFFLCAPGFTMVQNNQSVTDFLG